MTLAEFFSALAILGTLYGIWNQRRFMQAQAAVNFSQADSNNIKDALTLKAEYRKALEEIRSELEAEKLARGVVEEKLMAANAVIAVLQIKDVEREAAMGELKAQFEKENLLSNNALKLAHEKISSLEVSNSALLDRVSALENERKGWDNERRSWRNGIAILVDQVIKHNDIPGWRPPDTQPLGKLAT